MQRKSVVYYISLFLVTCYYIIFQNFGLLGYRCVVYLVFKLLVNVFYRIFPSKLITNILLYWIIALRNQQDDVVSAADYKTVFHGWFDLRFSLTLFPSAL